MLIDRRGRVVARVRLDENDFGDIVAGRPLVDDALAGYLRDDLWAQNGTMYFVSAAPVIKRDPPVVVRRRDRARPPGHQRARARSSCRRSTSTSASTSARTTSPAARRSPSITRAMQDAVKQARRRRPRARLPGEPADRAARGQRGLHRDRRAAARRGRGQAGLLLGVHQATRRPAASPARSRRSRRAISSFANFPWLLVGGGVPDRRSASASPDVLRGRSPAAPARRRRRPPREGRDGAAQRGRSTAASSARSRAA